MAIDLLVLDKNSTLVDGKDPSCVYPEARAFLDAQRAKGRLSVIATLASVEEERKLGLKNAYDQYFGRENFTKTSSPFLEPGFSPAKNLYVVREEMERQSNQAVRALMIGNWADLTAVQSNTTIPLIAVWPGGAWLEDGAEKVSACVDELFRLQGQTYDHFDRLWRTGSLLKDQSSRWDEGIEAEREVEIAGTKWVFARSTGKDLAEGIRPASVAWMI